MPEVAPIPPRQPFWRIPRLGSLWWALSAFWVFFGFLIANQILFGMRDHGHSWWRLFLWQAGSCVLWTLLLPVVLVLARRFPFALRPAPLLVHAGAALVLGALHLVWVTWLALLIDPYLPVSEASSFRDEYEFMLLHWLSQDVIIYVAIFGLATLLQDRERRKNERIRESVLQAELARAELRALRLELQPHFIFNALNAIVGLLRSGAPAGAEKMLIGLAELLRRTLEGRSRQRVPLLEELRLARLYLDIQRVRYGDRLEVCFDIESEARSALVPSLLLQPLVENSIRHGVGRRSGPGRITVRGRRREDRLVLEVIDDGLGPGVGAGGGSGVGLENVSSRLEALFAREWSLEMVPGASGGTEVRIELPWQEADAERLRDLERPEAILDPPGTPEVPLEVVRATTEEER